MENPASCDGPDRFLNRETSWLAFNERVLVIARDSSQPLLERIKFLAIVSSNLDEFFQVRVGALKALVDRGHSGASPDGRTPRSQLAAVRVAVLAQNAEVDELFVKTLLPSLAAAGVRIVSWNDLGVEERAELGSVFEREFFPVLTPLSVDPAHPFPTISNLSLNLAVVIRDPKADEHRFARVKVPALLPRFLQLSDGETFVASEQVIAAHLDQLFPGMEIVSHHVFRVTLDAELAIDGETEDLGDAIRSGLMRRHRMNDAVRLEVHRSISPQVRDLLQRELDVASDDVYVRETPIDLTGLWGIHGLDLPELKVPRWIPKIPRRLVLAEGDDLFRVLREGDLFVHHPYDSFGASVERFLVEAADDPDVLAIKHTLYRTSGRDNPLTRALTRAASGGKEVVALIELKARFDEESNLAWARELRRAGVHVVYGLVGLKTHAKIALVVRREADGVRRYWHIGTGNYNPVTAEHYEDCGILSSDPVIGGELTELFNYLTGCSRPDGYEKLVVAPEAMRERIIGETRCEAEAPDGRIVIKVNSLGDPEIIDALYDASQAGCSIDLVVRGICCLRPGVPGLSENIRVCSVLGRFLEHSRLFRFGSRERGARYWMGSADLMPSKLDRRVEALTRVDDPAVQRRIEEILQINLAENALAWELAADGHWFRSWPAAEVESQSRFAELASERTAAEDTRAVAPDPHRAGSS